MKKMFVILLLILLMNIVLIGCEKQEEESKINLVEVIMPIEEYALTMSSVPGLPLQINIDSNTKKDGLSIEISVQMGTLIKWDDTSKVVKLGDKALLKYEDQTIYWSPIVDDLIVKFDDTQVVVNIYKNNEILESCTFDIYFDKGIYKLGK